LRNLALKDARTTLQPFSSDFLSELMAAALSISMAGYNTCMDLISTRVKALVFPFPQNREQGLRAGKLERLGLVRVIADLDAASLARAISSAMNAPDECTHIRLNLAGAINTSLLVDEWAS